MSKQTTFAIALAIAAVIASQAHAGMSGTSDRVQQITNSEARATAPAQTQARPQPNPQVKAPLQSQAPAAARPAGGNFDGRWSVSSSPGCGLSARSAVQVKGGRIAGQGLSGSIDAAGNVRTVARGGGLSVVSTGRASGATASGGYRVSNGCTGTWTASKA
jgi:hypothetical protein